MVLALLLTQCSKSSSPSADPGVRYKWLVLDNGNERFYDLSNDAGENTNLLNGTLSDEAENALNVLRAKAEEIRQ